MFAKRKQSSMVRSFESVQRCLSVIDIALELAFFGDTFAFYAFAFFKAILISRFVKLGSKSRQRQWEFEESECSMWFIIIHTGVGAGYFWGVQSIFWPNFLEKLLCD